MKILLLLAVAAPAFGQVSISLQQADLAAIPGSTRSVYADVEGTKNLAVRWTASGGCTLASPSTTAAPQVVTALARGNACSLNMKLPTNETPSFVSETSCRVTAASVADPSKTASIVIPVCAPAVELSTFPESTVLYKNQPAVIQSNLRGSTDTGVRWAITVNPGGAGLLTGGSANRHAVFSAKAPGTYTLTATSKADPSKKASSTIFVTANQLPNPNADHTELVDCVAVGKGKTYEVGPARELHDLNAVPWNSLKGGDTVRIHNDDTTGAAPTTYHQHFSIKAGGTATQPLRVCGVPDAKGVKPIVDGANATTRPDEDWASGWLENIAIVSIHDPAHKWDEVPDQNQNIVIEGLHLRNANDSFSFVRQNSSALVPYLASASCVSIGNGRGILIRGNELENCSQGVFSNARTPDGCMVYNLTVQGNYVHGWGEANNIFVHGMYLQAIGLQVQFNYFGAPAAGAASNVIKSRSVMNFLRWNYLSQSATTGRVFDMVEPQSFSCYVIPFAFSFAYHGGGVSSDCYPPNRGPSADKLTADQVAANFETYHSDYIYGNIIDDGGANREFVHYGSDQGGEWAPAFFRRAGTLYYWSNTHLSRRTSGQKTLFDTVAPDSGHSYEYPTVQSVNNVFGADGKTAYVWTRYFGTQITVDSNWMYPGYVLPNRTTTDMYQGGVSSGQLLSALCDHVGVCNSDNGHLSWARGGKLGPVGTSLYTGTTPFDKATFVPRVAIRGLAAPLPAKIRDQPSNMEYFPATNKILPRRDLSFLGALD